MITFDRLEQIILLLNEKNQNELLFIESQFTLLKIDNKLETEIEQGRWDICQLPTDLILSQQSTVYLNIWQHIRNEIIKINNNNKKDSENFIEDEI